MANSQHRCVFVGNIPYDATEEQLVQICEEVGPVVSFRLVIDRETGKPKGYGFCEYKDEETALSARRNLHGYDINGRQLRVDFAENDKNSDRSREQGRGGPGLPTNTVHGDSSLNQVVGLQVALAAAIVMAGTLGNGQTNSNTSQLTLGTDLLTHHLAKIPQSQLVEVLTELKVMATQNKEQARQLLIAHPQLSKAALQAHIMLKSVPPHMLQMPSARQLPGSHVHPVVQGGPLAQPSSLQALPGLPPLAQTKLQLVSSVPNQYAAPSVPMQPPFQTPPQAQHQVLPHSTFSVPPVAGNLQSLHPQPPVRLSNRLENQMASSSSMLQYPGQNVLNSGHQTSQLVAPIQPSILAHKPTSSIASFIPNNRNKDHKQPQHLLGNSAWGHNIDLKDEIGQPSKLLKMEDGRGASFSPADLNLSASVLGSSQTAPLAGNQILKPVATDSQKQNHELPPGVETMLLQQVLNLTPEQLSSLPPDQQQQVLQLQQMLRQST